MTLMPERNSNDDLLPDDVPVVIDIQSVTKTYDLWSTPSARLTVPLMRRACRLPVGNYVRSILVRRINAGHHSFQALHKTSLQIRKGESWGIIGVNGSGKSTLLKMIAGNLRPSSGRIEVDGKVAILDFSSGLNPEFTGRENVYLKSAIFGIPTAKVDAQFDEIAGFADIGDFMEMPVKTYSSGMMARLGFAILTHVEADILITDEALAVGDAFFVQKCMRWIREFIERGTFLMVSHSINDVVSLCQNAIWLENGEVREIGSAKNVAEGYLASAEIRRSRRFKLVSDGQAAGEEENQAIEAAVAAAPATAAEVSQPELAALIHSKPTRVIKDPRLEYVNRSPWRNDIEVMHFDPSGRGIGIGGAVIEDVFFEDLDGSMLSWVIGGEVVRVALVIRVETKLVGPIAGFQVKDRLGQVLFSDNTYFATLDRPVTAGPGEYLEARFEFQMPLLPAGEYVIRAAVADGYSESENAMLHVIDNALALRCNTPGPRHGLIGVPMERISLTVPHSMLIHP